MAVAVGSVETGKHLKIGDVVPPLLHKITPEKIWGHIYWDTPVSKIVNASVAGIAVVGEGLLRTVHDIHDTLSPSPLSEEGARVAQAFAAHALQNRRAYEASLQEPYVAAYAVDVEMGRVHERRWGGQASYKQYEEPPPPPTRPLISRRLLPFEDCPTLPQIIIPEYNGSWGLYDDQQRAFERKFRRLSPRERVEYMQEVVRQKQEEKKWQLAALEEKARVVCQQLKARERYEQQIFDRALRRMEPFLLPRPTVIEYLRA